MAGPDTAAPIRYAGAEAQLSIARVSESIIGVTLAPIGAGGEPMEPPPSSILVDYPRELLWQGRALSTPVEVEVGGGLTVEIQGAPLSVAVRRADGSLVQRLSWPGEDGAMRFRTEAPVFGLGEGGPQFARSDPEHPVPQFDRRGHVYPMEGGWGAYQRPTHGARIAVPFLIGVDGWAMFVHHPISESNVFDLRKGRRTGRGVFRPGPEARERPLKLFVIAHEEPTEALTAYTRLAGHTPMPPKWALGYMQSHRTLAGPEQILRVARTFRRKNLPADALIYLGTGFTPSGWNKGHGSFEFNPKAFGEAPAELIEQLHALDFEVILHDYSAPEGLHGTSMQAPAGDSAHIGNYWERHTPLMQMGVDGWWPDGGEDLSAEGRVARHRMYYLGPLSERPNERPWSLHRTGYSGAHRYGGWIWTGDPDSYWKSLETHIAVGLNHSVSLSPFWGSDTGGFLPSDELTGELYIRWLQFSAFCPLFRSHGRAWQLRLPWKWSTGDMGPPEVDAFSDAFEDGYPNPGGLKNTLVEPIARQYLQLRYRMLPYNYTLARLAHETGVPLMRAMWVHYPDDAEAVSRGDQYLWGRNLLIAPVYEPGASERGVYLPEGTWYDFWTSERVRGGREVTRRVDLATLPIYVRAGAIVPLGPVRQYVGQETDEPTVVRVYPGRSSAYRWYRDDGHSMAYEEGKYSWTLFRWDDQARELTIAPGEQGQAPPPTELRIKVMTESTPVVRTLAWEGERQVVSFPPVEEENG